MKDKPRLLYGEYTNYLEGNHTINHQRELTNKLTEENIKFTLLGKNSTEKKDILHIFQTNFQPILSSYDIFIAHMGVEFQDQIGKILSDNPKLNLIIVTDHPHLYLGKEDNDRFLVCGYNSDKLIPFILGRLKK